MNKETKLSRMDEMYYNALWLTIALGHYRNHKSNVQHKLAK